MSLETQIVDSPRIKILHLEDRSADADQIGWILKKAGIDFNIRTVKTRKDYMEALDEFAPEVVISDHNLPSFDSLEALEIVRRSQLTIPFILVTGTVSEEFAVQAMRSGADDYLLKDRLNRLPSALVTALEKYRFYREQKEANRKMQESEAKYRSFFENSMDGILLTVPGGEILAANPAACRMFGKSEEEIRTGGRFALVDSDDPQAIALIRDQLQNNQARAEITFLRGDGTKFPGDISASTFDYSEGNRRTLMIIRDVTDRKNAESKIALTSSALEKSLRDLKKVMDSSMDMICAVDEKGNFIQVSAASKTILGYEPDELIGHSIFTFVHEEDRDKTDQSARHVMAGNRLAGFENRYCHKDGSVVTLAWSTRWDEIDRIRYGVARDVTEKNKAEERSKRSDTLLRNIDANSLDIICTIDEAGLFQHVSASSINVWGYHPSELIGRHFMDFVYSEDKSITTKEDRYIRDGNSVSTFENRYVRKDGSVVPILWSSKWEETEKVIYCIAKDATELKKAEKVIASERKRLSDLFMNAPVTMCIMKGADHTFELVNPVFVSLFGDRNYIDRNARDVFPEIAGQGFFEILDHVYTTGIAYAASETAVQIVHNQGDRVTIYLNLLLQPYFDADGKVDGVFYFGADVTEQVISRRKIEDSEQRYRQIVQTAQEGMWVVDENDRTTFVNKKMSELFEYEVDEMIGMDIYSFMDDEGKRLISERKKKNGLTEQGQSQFKYISRTGREIWTNVSANPLFRDNGSYAGSLSMITDITVQKKIEDENKKLSDIASLTVNAVIVVDSAGRITWVNKGFERITGYLFDEVVGRKPGHFLQGPNTDKTVSAYMGECAKRGQGFRVEILNYGKGGREYWLDIEARPMHDSQNRLTGFMAIEQDITERKKFEDTLMRRDHQLTLAAQISKLGYWEYDVKNDMLMFNDQFYAIYKLKAKQSEGYFMKSARYLNGFVHPADRHLVVKAVSDAIKSDEGEFTFNTEHRIIYADGEIGHISVHFRIVRDDAGNTVKTFGVNQDITDRKKVELDRIALIDNLQQRNKDLQQFSYIVSHNLRSPIAKILGLVSIMNEDVEENRFFLERLRDEATQLDTVVRDINTIVSARRAAKEDMELITFRSQLKLIKQLLEDKMSDSRAVISEDFSAAPKVLVIKSYLYSILYNLISNALKYRRPEVPLQINLATSLSGQFVCLSVQDNGEGIDMVANRTKVFSLYKRFHTGDVPGKGIGLNLVKTHAESLGGYVEVESELGRGSTFRVYIPVQR